jgi:hypothetical protein
MVRSIFSRRAKAAADPRRRHRWRRTQPERQCRHCRGRNRSFSPKRALPIFHTRACSRPPPPITNTFMVNLLFSILASGSGIWGNGQTGAIKTRVPGRVPLRTPIKAPGQLPSGARFIRASSFCGIAAPHAAAQTDLGQINLAFAVSIRSMWANGIRARSMMARHNDSAAPPADKGDCCDRRRPGSCESRPDCSGRRLPVWPHDDDPHIGGNGSERVAAQRGSGVRPGSGSCRAFPGRSTCAHRDRNADAPAW